MKVTFKGYDPEQGKKSMEESGGLVLRLRKSSPRALTPEEKLQRAEEDSSFPLDAQQQHDAMMRDD